MKGVCFTSEDQEGGRRHVLVYLGNSHRKGKRVLGYLIETTQIFATEVVKKGRGKKNRYCLKSAEKEGNNTKVDENT